MKNKLIGIIAGLVCCAVFGGAILFMSMSDSKPDVHGQDSTEQSSQESSQEEFTHQSGTITSREDISSVTVTSGGKSYTASVAANGIPEINELKGIKQNLRLANALISMCSKIQPYRLVEENAQDLKKYGLAEPSGVGEIVYKDKTMVRILVGDRSPSEEDYAYACIDGQKTVWLVENSVWLYLTGKAEDMVSPQMSPLLEKTASADAKMVITKKGADGTVLERKDDKWKMTAPINAELDMQKASACVNGLYGLSAEYCECIRPDKDKLAEYGLKEPAVTVGFKEGTAELELYIGSAVKRNDESEKEKYYCYLKGSEDTDCIYAVAKEYLPWVEIAAQDIVSEVMLPNYLVNLKRITVTAGGKTTEYVITNEGGDSSKINEDISKMRTASVTSGGKELELIKFRKFYELLMKCPTNRIFTQDVNSEAYITVVYSKNDGTADRLELVKAGEGLGARVNGKMSYLVPQSWADAVIADIDALAQGKELRTEF